MGDQFRVFEIRNYDTGAALRAAVDVEDVCCWLGVNEMVSRMMPVGVQL